jgi:hypothetical protein
MAFRSRVHFAVHVVLFQAFRSLPLCCCIALLNQRGYLAALPLCLRSWIVVASELMASRYAHRNVRSCVFLGDYRVRKRSGYRKVGFSAVVRPLVGQYVEPRCGAIHFARHLLHNPYAACESAGLAGPREGCVSSATGGRFLLLPYHQYTRLTAGCLAIQVYILPQNVRMWRSLSDRKNLLHHTHKVIGPSKPSPSSNEAQYISE